jgi:hypothetical protein
VLVLAHHHAARPPTPGERDGGEMHSRTCGNDQIFK